MAVLTIWERFKDAREVYNPHGKQTLEQVTKATGVSESMISSLESEHSDRNVGYKNIIALAKHYGVSIDWLLGQTDVIAPDPTLRSVAEYLHLPESFIDNLLVTLKDVPREKIDAIFDFQLTDLIARLCECLDIMMVNEIENVLDENCFREYHQLEATFMQKVNAIGYDMAQNAEEETKICDLHTSSYQKFKKHREHTAMSGLFDKDVSRMILVQAALEDAWDISYKSLEETQFLKRARTGSYTKLYPLIYATAEKAFQHLLNHLGDESDKIVHSIFADHPDSLASPFTEVKHGND